MGWTCIFILYLFTGLGILEIFFVFDSASQDLLLATDIYL